MSVPISYFDALYAQSGDPWEYRKRWYEARKRDLTLAALPHPRYGRVYEAGCSIGELSAQLAHRCDSLLVSDGSEAAVQRARQRLADYPHARVEHRLLPDTWPAGPFDLIVISEIGYYFDSDPLAQLLEQARASLAPEGVVLACHWRYAIAGCTLTGDDVHEALDARLGLPRIFKHEEADFRIDVWSATTTSVADREHLR